MREPIDVLNEIWAYPSFREGQAEIIREVMDGKDILALLPTGGGKSLCYQVPALCRDGITLVISPLISLMQDQVQSLKQKKVKAEAIYSGMSYSLIDSILDNCIYGDIKLLYVSPERLQSDLFLERLKQMKVQMIAVDEAHCISQWGYDFRPAYLNILSVLEVLPEVQIIGLTATAPPKVAADICESLRIPQEHIITSDFRRPNLHYMVNPTVDKQQELIALLKATRGAAIVYCRRRNQTERIALALRKRGISALPYHAGYSSEKRAEIQEKFMQDDVRVIAATTAFGMGIDKSNVRYVYHIEPPMSPEEYFQEAGRAGRDKEDAWCVLFYNKSDKQGLIDRKEQAYPPVEYIKNLYRSLALFFKLAYGSGAGEQFLFDIDAFCTRFKLDKNQAYYGLKFIEKSAWILLTEGLHQPSRLRIILDRNNLYNQQVKNKKLDIFMRYLLRAYEGLFTDMTIIHELKIARELKISREDLVQYLEQLNKQAIVEYQAASTEPKITFLLPVSTPENFSIDMELYDFLKERSEERLRAMVAFAEAEQCREKVMLSYFGQEVDVNCGRCDYCLGSYIRVPNEEDKRLIIQGVFNALPAGKSVSVPRLLRLFPLVFRKRVLYCLDKLEDEGRIIVNEKQNVQRNEE